MSRTDISTKTATMQAKKEGILNWVGALILEVIMCIVAFYLADLISESAGLWHHKASLGHDLWKYYGSRLSYADRAAKWFGFRKAWGAFARAVVLEFFSFRLFSSCLGVEFSTNVEDAISRTESILTIGAAVRLVVYTGAVFFSRSSSLYGPLHGDWEFEEIYNNIAAYDSGRAIFWGLIYVGLAMIIRAFVFRRRKSI